MTLKRLLLGVIALIIGTLLVNVTGMALEDQMQPNLIYRLKSKDLPAFREQQDYNAGEFAPLVRLHTKSNKFFCSGTVISDDYVLTAAHCLMKHGLIPRMTGDDINIVSIAADTTGEVLTVVARAAALNNRADYALVKGDFKRFHKARILTRPDMFNELVGPAAVCGFPWGSTDICYGTLGGLKTDFDKFAVEGRMYPGMSGGPVVDTGARAVFAINTAVGEGFIIIAPLIGLFETLEIEVIK